MTQQNTWDTGVTSRGIQIPTCRCKFLKPCSFHLHLYRTLGAWIRKEKTRVGRMYFTWNPLCILPSSPVLHGITADCLWRVAFWQASQKDLYIHKHTHAHIRWKFGVIRKFAGQSLPKVQSWAPVVCLLVLEATRKFGGNGDAVVSQWGCCTLVTRKGILFPVVTIRCLLKWKNKSNYCIRLEKRREKLITQVTCEFRVFCFWEVSFDAVFGTLFPCLFPIEIRRTFGNLVLSITDYVLDNFLEV